MKMTKEKLKDLLEKVLDRPIKVESCRSIGHEHYGDKSADGSFIFTDGFSFSTKGSFSKHKLDTGHVTDTGEERSEKGEIAIKLCSAYQDTGYLELTVIQGDYDYRITRDMKKVLMELLEYFEIIEVDDCYSAGTPICSVTFLLKNKDII